MLSTIITILLFLIVAGFCWWACNALIGAFGIPQPIATVIIVVVMALLLIGFLDMVGIFGAGGGLRLGTLR